jgi:phenylacetate-CoA ligase
MSGFRDAYANLVGGKLLPFYEGRLRGRHTYDYRAEFEQNQWLTPQKLQDLQWRRLQALLDHAYRTVPHYFDAFIRAGLRPQDLKRPADLERLPILDRAVIRERPHRLMSASFKPEQLIQSATGGSTGELMRFRYDRESFDRRAAAAMRGDSWAGWGLCLPEFYIWGIPLMPQSRLKRLKVQVHHGLLRRTIVSSFDLTPEKVTTAARFYRRQKPRVVVGYANALYEFARCVKAAGIALPPPNGVISSAEKLYPYQRALVEEVFGAPVFDRYGCREVMLIGAECREHCGLHVTADNLYVEIVNKGTACEPGEPGEILLTDLHNYGMPLIRYRVGDIGAWKGKDCPCGRGLPLLKVVEGRVLDVITTPSGRAIAGEFFPHLFKDFAAIRRYQVVQETRERVRVRAALSAPLEQGQRALLERKVAEMLGPELRVDWEMGQDVVVESTGKFRPVRSMVTADAPSTPAK